MREYEVCPESIHPFWIFPEPVSCTLCNLAASHRIPYCPWVFSPSVEKSHASMAISNYLCSIRWYRAVQSKNTINNVVYYLLLRQHVLALVLGHHQVSNCASEETIQCINCNEISLVAWPLTNIERDYYYEQDHRLYQVWVLCKW